MRDFVDLYLAVDASNKTSSKVAALVEYFRGASALDAAWATALLSGKRLRVPVKRSLIRQWALEVTGLPDWLFDESYQSVGDMSETLSLLLPEATLGSRRAGLAEWMHWISKVAGLPEDRQRDELREAWASLSRPEIFVLHKLMGGSFRVGVSRELVHRGLALARGLEKASVTHRLMGQWSPSATFFDDLARTGDEHLVATPYPFCLAHPWEGDWDGLGDREEWQVEWKWDGIRAQLIRRAGQTFLWSRGEELIADTFPEVAAIGAHLPDGTVLDGEILAHDGEQPMPFAQLQRRLGRKVVGKTLLAEVPCRLIAFDLLEWAGTDLRGESTLARRSKLAAIVAETAHDNLRLSEVLELPTWSELAEVWHRAREFHAEGFMLKLRDANYAAGRHRGAWWKLKSNPFSVDAVLIYAQRGTGKRASLYTDYTFGVWDGDALVPFAKAYSGLTDAEIRRVDSFIRKNIREKFGPVRTVAPELVFEIAFEGIQASSRHKSGIAVRFPRIMRWREDKRPPDANTLADLRALIGGGE